MPVAPLRGHSRHQVPPRCARQDQAEKEEREEDEDEDEDENENEEDSSVSDDYAAAAR